MKTAADVVIALERTNSRLDKERVLRDAWQAGIQEFFQGAQWACDSLKTFGVKKVPALADQDPGNFRATFHWRDFQSLAEKLHSRELSGNAARDAISLAADGCSQHDWNHFYRRVLLKDLRCGVTETTINKVLKAQGNAAQAFLIPVFSCQLAEDGTDHPQRIAGLRMLDNKLDGVRLLTVLDCETHTVTQYTRNGKTNDNFPQLVEFCQQLLPSLKHSIVLEGEVVSNNFQALMTQINRRKNVDTSDAHLALFDVVPLKDFRAGRCNIKQQDRHDILLGLSEVLTTASGGKIYVLPKLTVDLDTAQGQETYREFNRDALEAGFEGIMIKDPQAGYATKRGFAWLKVKPFFTVDLEVQDILPGTPGTKFENTMGAILFHGWHEAREISVSVGSGYTDKQRDEIWLNKDILLGRVAEIETDVLTQSQNSEVWSLRFPRFVRWRGWEPGEKL